MVRYVLIIIYCGLKHDCVKFKPSVHVKNNNELTIEPPLQLDPIQIHCYRFKLYIRQFLVIIRHFSYWREYSNLQLALANSHPSNIIFKGYNCIIRERRHMQYVRKKICHNEQELPYNVTHRPNFLVLTEFIYI